MEKGGGDMELLWTRLNGQTGHEAAYALLAQAVGDLPKICYTDRGKPFFPEKDLHFSISHTKNHAFCAVSHQNIGIDAEETDRKVRLHLADRYLSPAEKARFDAAENKAAALLRLWVLKESYAKLTGRGLGDYLKNTDFDPEDPRIQIIDGCFVAVMEE